MRKTFIFVVLLLSLFAYKVNAAPNTGPLPENGVKINFNADGTYNSIEGNGWMVDQHDESLKLTKGEVVVHLMHYEFNDDGEIIGFHWMVEGATAILWVKHGTTEEIYGEGTEGDFLTSDNKQVSNVVFLIEIIVDEEEEVDDEEEEDDEEEVDEEEVEEEEEEVDEEEEEEEEDDEEEVDEEEVVDEEEEEEEVDEEEEVVEEEEEVDEEEVVDEEEEEVDEEEEVVEQEEEVDEEEVVDEEEDDDEVLGEEEENVDEEEDDEVLGEEEENVDEEEDEVLGEEESLPDTSDATAGLGLLSGLFGFMLLFATKKKNT